MGTRCHAAPFQCRIRLLRSLSWPTAQAFLADVAATAARLTVRLRGGVGRDTRCHAVPFQCRIRLLTLPTLTISPTAQAFRADVAATPRSRLRTGDGAGIRLHAVPFQCRINVPPAWPTAHAFVPDVAA